MNRQLLASVLALATATGVALAQDAKKDGKKGAKSVSVRMHAQNKSGESGSAKLTPAGADKTRVEISLKGAPKGTAQPAHIHEGSCAKLDPKPKYGLENVVDGKSTTEVPVGLDKVRGMAINVHKSADDLKTYVSCGNIGKGGGAMKKGGMEKKS
jgi:Cu/Zn superoxide dismutase